VTGVSGTAGAPQVSVHACMNLHGHASQCSCFCAHEWPCPRRTTEARIPLERGVGEKEGHEAVHASGHSRQAQRQEDALASAQGQAHACRQGTQGAHPKARPRTFRVFGPSSAGPLMEMACTCFSFWLNSMFINNWGAGWMCRQSRRRAGE